VHEGNAPTDALNFPAALNRLLAWHSARVSTRCAENRSFAEASLRLLGRYTLARSTVSEHRILERPR
jgi:hypothetical protein